MTTQQLPRTRGSGLARNALLNLASLVVPLLVAFVSLPLIIGGLGVERFGVLSIVWLLLTYLSELGFGTATTRYTADALGAGKQNELAGVLWTTAALQAGIGLLSALLLAAATPWLAGSALNIRADLVAEARVCFYLLAATLPLLSLGRALRGMIEGAQRFDLAFAVQVPITAIGYLLIAVGAQAGWSLISLMMLLLASRLLAVPAYYAAVHKALPGVSLRPVMPRSRLRDLSFFAGWVAVSTIVSPLLVYLDRFMIGVLLSMTAVAFYAAPYEIVGRLMLIPGAIMGALLPALSQLSAQSDRAAAERIAVRSLVVLIAVIAPAVILILGAARDGLALWLGADFAARSATALQVLAVGLLVNAIAHVPFGLLYSAGRPDLPARFHLIELPIQLVLAWLLIGRFGITGAALAWSARISFDAALLFRAAQREQLLRRSALRGHFLARTFAVVAVAAGAAVLTAWYLPTSTLRLSTSALLALASAALLWTIAVPVGERSALALMIRRPS